MTEHDHQKIIIKYLRLQYPLIKFTVNPFSGVEFHRMSKLQKMRFLQEMKALGWERSQPDIMIHAARCGFHHLSLELKTDETYPFRNWRNTDQPWIEKTNSTKARQHIMDQATYLHHLRREDGLAVFCPGYEKAIALIDLYFEDQVWKMEEALTRYEFRWQNGSDKWIHRLKTA